MVMRDGAHDITFRSREADGAFELELFDQRLAVGSLSAEAKKAQRRGRDMHFHAHESVSIQEPMASENSGDGAHTRESHTGVRTGGFKRDGIRADKAQIALRGQRVAEGNKGGFESRRSLPSLRVRSRTEVEKGRLWRAHARRSGRPMLNPTKRNAEAGGDGALREPHIVQTEDVAACVDGDGFSSRETGQGMAPRAFSRMMIRASDRKVTSLKVTGR